jgi:crotonobetainyl-CoA:carnitine CoA-transferase CaiB-like acyl-CoA transferase
VRARDALDAQVQALLADRPFKEVTEALDRHAIAYGTVSTVGDLIDHPAATSLAVPTPQGEVEVLAPPAIVNGERVRPRPVPALGQHDISLRAEFAPAP